MPTLPLAAIVIRVVSVFVPFVVVLKCESVPWAVSVQFSAALHEDAAAPVPLKPWPHSRGPRKPARLSPFWTAVGAAAVPAGLAPDEQRAPGKFAYVVAVTCAPGRLRFDGIADFEETCRRNGGGADAEVP